MPKNERLKRGTYLTDKYFDEQLERIREIRVSERKFYQKITDIYATVIDYDKSDVTIAKNYLSENELHQMNRIVTAYLDFAENMTLRHIPLTMEEWEKRLNSFIEMSDYDRYLLELEEKAQKINEKPALEGGIPIPFKWAQSFRKR